MGCRLIKGVKSLNIKVLISSNYFILFTAALIYVIFVSSLAIASHYSFYTNAWDLGIYAQALYNTLNHGKILYYTTEAAGNPSKNLFGIHFSPFLLFLVPIYAICESPITLLVLRPLAISIGLIPFYWIMRENGIGKRIFIILFTIIYLIYPPMLFPISNFDIAAFLPALFLFALYYLRRGDHLRAYMFILLALMINEFVSFIVVATAVYTLLLNWRGEIENLKRKKITRNMIFSLALLFTGILWFMLASTVITHFNQSALRTKWEWGDLGTSPGEIVLNVLTNPVKALNALYNDGPKKFLYIISLLGPLAFTSLLDPSALIMALPWLTASLLSINPLYYSIETQYPAFASPFIFLSAIDGIKKLRGFNMDIMKRVIFLMFIILLISTLLLPSGVYFRYEESSDAIWLALREIPPDSSVSVMPEIYPHLCNRLEIYPYFIDGVDYVLINVYSWWYDVTFPRPSHVAVKWCDAQIGGEYGIILNMKGTLLYKRGYSGPVKYFSGVNFTYMAHDFADFNGKIVHIQDEPVVGDALIYKAGENDTLLLFRAPYRFLPPGGYNITAFLKVPSDASGSVRFELRTKPGERVILVREFFSENLAVDRWRTLNFSFTIKNPMPIEIVAYVSNLTDVYFYSLNVLQVSGA